MFKTNPQQVPAGPSRSHGAAAGPALLVRASASGAPSWRSGSDRGPVVATRSAEVDVERGLGAWSRPRP